MKRSTPVWLAAASALLWIGATGAARPRYGGTLRVATAAAMRTLNPAVAPLDDADADARRVLFPLIFETLITTDSGSALHGVLALTWDSNADATEWRFRLRTGVRLHDDTPLDSTRVAAALRARAPAWRIDADGGSITIRLDRPIPDLPWQLAEDRYAIAFGRSGGGEPIGTGPFAIERWEPRRLRLRAHEAHWAGRAFVDAVQVDMARPVAEQVEDVELGRVDMAAIGVNDVRRLSGRGLRVVPSAPRELVALVSMPDGAPAPAVRQALARAVDRNAIWSALFQRQGEPANSLLPAWITGYAALVRTPLDRAWSRSTIAAVPAPQRRLTLRIADADPLLRAVADRIVVDARDVGLTIDVAATAVGGTRPPHIELRRASVSATTPERALVQVAHAFGIALPPELHSLDAVYRAEQALIDQGAVIPLVHVPDLYAVGARVASWNAPLVQPSGAWNVGDVWLEARVP